jgi:hypothetical protein
MGSQGYDANSPWIDMHKTNKYNFMCITALYTDLFQDPLDQKWIQRLR